MPANVYTVVFIREVDGDDYEQGTSAACVEQLRKELQACYDSIEVAPAGSFQIIKAETLTWPEVNERFPAGQVDTANFVEHFELGTS